MHSDPLLGVGVIGLGFMGRTHVASYLAAPAAGHPCRLAAVCDSDAHRRAGAAAPTVNVDAGAAQALFDPRQTAVYADPADLIADPAVGLVSICTPTDTHVDLAIRALAAGKHVLVEKPVALHSADVRRLADAARSVRSLCMPAFCMRFWPQWRWLKEHIAAATYGRVLSAAFQRLGGVPGWSPEFYRNAARSGGALADLHIHDADFVRWCFGSPESVVSTGSVHHLTTLYRFPAGPPHVTAEGAWLPVPGFSFRMRYLVAFEQAVADFDLTRDPPLLLTRDGRAEPVTLAATSAYDLQAWHLLDAIASGRRPLDATLADAESVARLLEAEQQSLATNGSPVRPLPG